MKIRKTVSGSEMTLAVRGCLDESTVSLFEDELQLEGITRLVLDFRALKSDKAGMIALVEANETMKKQGSMTLTKARRGIREVFDFFGLSAVMTIK